MGVTLAEVACANDWPAALFLLPVLAPLTLAAELLEAVDLGVFLAVIADWTTILAALGVGWLVQYHVPLASAQAIPSLAIV